MLNNQIICIAGRVPTTKYYIIFIRIHLVTLGFTEKNSCGGPRLYISLHKHE